MNSFVFLWMLTAQLASDDKLPIDEVKGAEETVATFSIVARDPATGRARSRRAVARVPCRPYGALRKARCRHDRFAGGRGSHTLRPQGYGDARRGSVTR